MGGRTKQVCSHDPATLSRAFINKELDWLDEVSSACTTELILAGRGTELPTETCQKTDALSRKACSIWDRQAALRAEMLRRYGPGAPSRLPRGFGPIKGF